MTANLRCGEWVFVHPGERGAPARVRGLAGPVMRVFGACATIQFHESGRLLELDVDVSLLQRDRRRRNRPPAHWPRLAQAG